MDFGTAARQHNQPGNANCKAINADFYLKNNFIFHFAL